ncbi:hypothetical protein Nmel_018348 [Mimus melanotis]
MKETKEKMCHVTSDLGQVYKKYESRVDLWPPEESRGMTQVHLGPRAMSCCKPCNPCCQPCGPTPLANSCNECCVRQCQDSHVAIQPSPVVVTLPGPILSSFPQNTVVGSSTSAAVGNILSCGGVPISSGGFDLSCITNCYGSSRCRPC